jgi:hypothetical protein
MFDKSAEEYCGAASEAAMRLANCPYALPLEFKLGDEVIWSSQSAGYTKVKRGRVAAIVGRDCDPRLCVPEGLILKNPGIPRKRRSYLIQVGKSKRLYWPNAKYLGYEPQLVEKQAPKLCSCGNKKQEGVPAISCRPPVMAPTVYGEAHWVPDDVCFIRPTWPLNKCAEELAKVADQVATAMVERGWEVLEDLLPA